MVQRPVSSRLFSHTCKINLQVLSSSTPLYCSVCTDHLILFWWLSPANVAYNDARFVAVTCAFVEIESNGECWFFIKDEGPEGEGTIDFSPVDDGTGGCVVSWSAMLTLEAAHRVLSSPTLMLELVR